MARWGRPVTEPLPRSEPSLAPEELTEQAHPRAARDRRGGRRSRRGHRGRRHGQDAGHRGARPLAAGHARATPRRPAAPSPPNRPRGTAIPSTAPSRRSSSSSSPTTSRPPRSSASAWTRRGPGHPRAHVGQQLPQLLPAHPHRERRRRGAPGAPGRPRRHRPAAPPARDHAHPGPALPRGLGPGRPRGLHQPRQGRAGQPRRLRRLRGRRTRPTTKQRPRQLRRRRRAPGPHRPPPARAQVRGDYAKVRARERAEDAGFEVKPLPARRARAHRRAGGPPQHHRHGRAWSAATAWTQTSSRASTSSPPPTCEDGAALEVMRLAEIGRVYRAYEDDARAARRSSTSASRSPWSPACSRPAPTCCEGGSASTATSWWTSSRTPTSPRSS